MATLILRDGGPQEVELVENSDGSVTVVVGAWCVLRLTKNGRIHRPGNNGPRPGFKLNDNGQIKLARNPTYPR